MLKIVIALALVAYCSAGDEAKSEYSATESYTYHGKYPGKCSNDGLYYKNERTFVFCSNGNSYDQDCAPGSRNSGYDNYSYGGNYGYRDFCDVNLVDEGYAAKHSGYGHSGHRNGGYNDGYHGGYDGGYHGGYNGGYDGGYDGGYHGGYRGNGHRYGGYGGYGRW